MRFLKRFLFALVFFIAAPVAVHAILWWSQDHASGWATADWSSTNTLPLPSQHRPAMVRIYVARTGRWKGVFATHSWIVLKPEGAAYERWDKVGWGRPIRRNNYAPDGRWYGNDPRVIFAADGARAAALIPKIRQGIARYPFYRRGDYHVWPGPNSNTFVAAALAAVPEIDVTLPSTAIGKDFPLDGSWAGLTPSHTGFRVSLGGYAGLVVGWVEGIEINILGAVLGIDIRHPALKLPGLGQVGL